MNRDVLEKFIIENYDTDPDYPWFRSPNHAVFRHTGNRKWFALIMEIPKNKLGFSETNIIDIVNFKCDPLLINSLLEEKGFFPAYHMNKESWITAALDGSANDDTIKMLLNMSYDATAPKPRKK